MTNETPAGSPPNEEAVRNVLRRVIDPEVGMNIIDLGLVYLIKTTPEGVLIEMTMTSPACPMGEMIVDEVCAALAEDLPDSGKADVRLVWEPPWNPSMMSECGRQHFGW